MALLSCDLLSLEAKHLCLNSSEGLALISLFLCRPPENSCCLGNNEWGTQNYAKQQRIKTENLQCVLARALIEVHKKTIKALNKSSLAVRNSVLEVCAPQQVRICPNPFNTNGSGTILQYVTKRYLAIILFTSGLLHLTIL